MKKGFTLVELVAVVSLLGILLLFTYTKIADISEKKSKELLESKKTLVINAAKEYINQYEDLYPQIDGMTMYISIETLYNENLIPVEVDDLIEKSNYLQVKIGSSKNTYNFIKEDLADICPGKNCVYTNENTRRVIGDTLNEFSNDYNSIESDSFVAYQLTADKKITKAYSCLKLDGKVECLRGSLKEDNIDYFKVYSLNINQLIKLFGTNYNSLTNEGCKKGNGGNTLECFKGNKKIKYNFSAQDYVTVEDGTKTCYASYENGIYCDL